MNGKNWAQCHEMMPLSKPGLRAVDATQRTLARTRASATDTNQPQPILTLAATVSPEAAAIGERVLVRWEATNLDSQDVTLTYDAENRLTGMVGGATTLDALENALRKAGVIP
jgi:hypothetical protein